MRAFAVIRKIPPASTGGPQVIGVVLVHSDGIACRFQSGVDEEPFRRAFCEVHLHGAGLTGYQVEEADGVSTCWEIPAEPDVDIDMLFHRWGGPSHFF